MSLEYALKRLEWAAHKILRTGHLAADSPPRIPLPCDIKLWTTPFPEQCGVANLRFKGSKCLSWRATTHALTMCAAMVTQLLFLLCAGSGDCVPTVARLCARVSRGQRVCKQFGLALQLTRLSSERR